MSLSWMWSDWDSSQRSVVGAPLDVAKGKQRKSREGLIEKLVMTKNCQPEHSYYP